MNDDKLRQVHAAIESLKLPTNKRASIEQMNGRKSRVDGAERVETDREGAAMAGEDRAKRIKRLKKKLRRANARREQRNAPQAEPTASTLRIADFPIEPSPGVRMSVVYGVVV